MGGIGIEQHAVLAAVHEDHAVDEPHTGIVLAEFIDVRRVKYRAPSEPAAVFYGEIRKGRLLAGIHRKAHAVQVGIGIAHLRHDQALGIHHHIVHREGERAGGAEDVHVMSFILVGLGDQRVQVGALPHHRKGNGGIVVRIIAHAVDVELRAALRGQARKIPLHAHVVFARQTLRIEGGMPEPEIVRAQDEGRLVAALAQAHIRADMEHRLAGGVQRQARSADPLRAVPGVEAVVHQRSDKGRGLGVDHIAGLIDDAHLPGVSRRGIERLALIDNADGLAAFDQAGIPDHGAAFVPHGDLVGLLCRADRAGGHLPGKGRLRGVHADGIAPALGLGIDDGGVGRALPERGQPHRQHRKNEEYRQKPFHVLPPRLPGLCRPNQLFSKRVPTL